MGLVAFEVDQVTVVEQLLAPDEIVQLGAEIDPVITTTVTSSYAADAVFKKEPIDKTIVKIKTIFLSLLK